MELNLLTLLAEGVIGFDDLTDFSEELQERIAFMVRNMN